MTEFEEKSFFFVKKFKANKKKITENNPLQNSAASNSPHSAVDVFFIRKLLN